jgi:hypothetical protein
LFIVGLRSPEERLNLPCIPAGPLARGLLRGASAIATIFIALALMYEKQESFAAANGGNWP